MSLIIDMFVILFLAWLDMSLIIDMFVILFLAWLVSKTESSENGPQQGIE